MKQLLFYHLPADEVASEESDLMRAVDAEAEAFDSLVFAPESDSPLVPELQCLSLIRRQFGKVISMKLVMRNHGAE